MLPLRRDTGAQRSSQVSLATKPQAAAIVVLVKERILAPRKFAAGVNAAEYGLQLAIEFSGRTFLAAPGRRKRHAAPLANRIGCRNACTVREPITVLKFENRHEHQAKPCLAHDPGRVVWTGSQTPVAADRNGTFVDDNDERN